MPFAFPPCSVLWGHARAARRPRSRMGEEEMAAGQAWKRVLGDYFSGDALTEWRTAKERLGPGFDHEGYAAAWVGYNARVQAALPLDPGSEATKAIVAEWDRLCAVYLATVDEPNKARVNAL